MTQPNCKVESPARRKPGYYERKRIYEREIAWSGTCQSNYSYIEEVGVEQALQDEWESMMDGLEEDYSFKRFKMTASEKRKYINEAI